MTVFPSRPEDPERRRTCKGRLAILATGSTEPAASKSAASVVLSAAKAPVLSWKDDFATRHLDLGEPP
jgi:hypothetical protein